MSAMTTAAKPSMATTVAAHAGVLLCSILFWLSVASRWSLVCNYRADEFRSLCDFASDFVTDMETSALPARSLWLTNGGALATMRERDRQNNFFIANDHDFDLCVDTKQLSELLTAVRQSNKYWFEYYPDARKIRVFPEWARLYRGHSGVFCLDVDVCSWQREPLERVRGCNGHEWTRASFNDNVEHFKVEYPGSNWEVPSADNHLGTCQVLGNW
jgi:hypothetical protein